ncbi:hypothetical protein [Candidatus Desulfovibrio trichonymphae]|uniref:hypothetical protein n=1 Tax=Candidatus Desulfovibrio trichonymphae TaxID=1725232 RepID=UPI000BBA99CA|nr:hypothetical protein [Candidatus Desulfovibrio trichonymphae]GHU91068.1 hypothetical protein AGMMS49925_05000 [Deltaproteobacteria bacterium]GHU94985.1 hypothetical protein AGMMS49974_05510 [Deltaproteobacteria bacterium]GHU98418.1 hypothetical protein AGMMS50248_04970 [Deltaproteobacteria bacterium]
MDSAKAFVAIAAMGSERYAYKYAMRRIRCEPHSRSRMPLLPKNVACCDIAELGAGFPGDYGLGLCLDV